MHLIFSGKCRIPTTGCATKNKTLQKRLENLVFLSHMSPCHKIESVTPLRLRKSDDIQALLRKSVSYLAKIRLRSKSVNPKIRTFSSFKSKNPKRIFGFKQGLHDLSFKMCHHATAQYNPHYRCQSMSHDASRKAHLHPHLHSVDMTCSG